MMFYQLLLFFLLVDLPVHFPEVFKSVMSFEQVKESKILKVKKTADFEISGDGSAGNWSLTEWEPIPQRTQKDNLMLTKAKVLYSDKGIYFLFYCEDKMLTNSMNADFMDLWTEDVVEVFLMPDKDTPAYFEYEISPLNYELPILVSNDNGDLVRWMPFHYDNDRKVIHATSVKGGEKESNAWVKSWVAEFFIPYKLLRPLKYEQPVPGTQWKANLYRLDYDENNKVRWSWNLIETNFHDYKNFGTLIFE